MGNKLASATGSLIALLIFFIIKVLVILTALYYIFGRHL